MSALPVFADPSTKVMYQPVHPPNNSSQSFVAGGHAQHPAPPTMAMVVVQNNPQPQPQSSPLANSPLPPGMEIVLGDKKYTIQYQSYEMTREKATEYIAKCTGTPYSRMSSPPDPVTLSRPPGDVGVSRAGGREGTWGTAVAKATAPAGMVAAGTAVGDRGGMASQTAATATEEQQQRLKIPDEVYTMITPAASGLPPAPSSTEGPVSQHQHQPQQQQPPMPKIPDTPQVVVTGNSTYPPPPAYAPPPQTPPGGVDQQQQQNLGYYWEDGVWKAWQANSENNSSGDAKMPPPQPIPVQHSQQPPLPQPYTAAQQPQVQQPERPQYQYQYQYSYAQQQQPQPQPQTSFATAAATYDPAAYAVPQQQQPLQIPQIRGPPLPIPPGVIRHASGSTVSTTTNTDPMLPRYI